MSSADSIFRRPDSLMAVAAAYASLSVLMTWPLTPALLRALPSDLGDPVLNCWILARNARWFADLLTGQASSFWDGRIFHPASLTMAFSEHLVAPSLQALPLYAATGNAVFAYNVLLLSTFFLSAFGMFLLIRAMTGHTSAAFLAGLFYGFSPYRVDQLSHLQVLSSQWMPFALLGLRLFVESGRALPLAGAVIALLASSLSCGYYAVSFLPVAGLYAAFELVRGGHLRDQRRVLGLVSAAAAIGATIVPFLTPYWELHGRGLLVRSRPEVERYSADVLSSFTAPEGLRLWGGVLNALPTTTEGTLFLGFVPVAFAAAAVIAASRKGLGSETPRPDGVVLPRRAGGSETLFFLAVAVVAWALALGPTIRFGGRVIGPGPFGLLYGHVSGFDGLRVPARFTMVVALAVSVLAGKGAAALLRRDRRGVALAIGAGIVFILEAAAVPLAVHPVGDDPALRPLMGVEASLIYRDVARLPRGSVLAEMPIASDPDELRAMVPALQHGHRLANGYSGFRPAAYLALRPALLLTAPDRVWAALEASGVTHVVVHQRAWSMPGKGRRVVRWLEERGATVQAATEGDVLLALPPPALLPGSVDLNAR